MMPTLHNPTSVTMPARRRQQIVEIVRKYGLFVIEDDVYGYLAPDVRPLFDNFAPDRAVYLTSLAKAITPGMRVGYVRASVGLRERLEAASGFQSDQFRQIEFILGAKSETALTRFPEREEYTISTSEFAVVKQRLLNFVNKDNLNKNEKAAPTLRRKPARSSPDGSDNDAADKAPPTLKRKPGSQSDSN